jgi:hypothetical protein
MTVDDEASSFCSRGPWPFFGARTFGSAPASPWRRSELGLNSIRLRFSSCAWSDSISSCRATRSLPCAAISARVRVHDPREQAAILGLEKNGCLTQHVGGVLALEVDVHDPAVMLDPYRARKRQPTLRSERDARRDQVKVTRRSLGFHAGE